MSNSTENIELEPYSPSWLEKFQKEATKIREAIGEGNIISIEHIGSTAIPGISAKPIIDIAIGVQSLETAKNFLPVLEKMGYSFWDKNPKKDRMFFVKGLPPNGPRTFHVHIMEASGDELPKRILFREYMRTHPEEADKYEALKKELSEKYKQDREAYTEAKSDFISNVIKRINQSH